MADELFCVVDAGTSGVKVGLVDSLGTLVRSAYRAYGSTSSQPGFIEQSVEELFAAEIAAFNELLDGVRSQIAAVSCSSQRATVIGLTAGTPRPFYIGWQDRRGMSACQRMREELGEQEFYTRTGLVIDPVASWSKIDWMRRHDPGVDEFSTHQGVLLRQLGVSGNLCAPSEASYVGLYDIRHGAWNAELTEMVGIETDQLPTVIPSGTQVGEVSDPRVVETGLPAGTPIVMGGGDLQLGVLGTGVVDPGMVATGIGTGGHCVTPVNTPVLDPERRLNCLAHVEAATWEVEGLARASGGALRWMRESFAQHRTNEAGDQGVDVYDLMTSDASRWPPGTDGLVFVPALAGLGAPVNAPEFSGTLVGLRLQHDQAAVTRALMEGVCFEQRSILDAVVSLLGATPCEVRAWGGGAKSETWCQMQADIYGVPVARTREQDTSLIGAAICGGVATDALVDIDAGVDQMVHIDRRWEPDDSTSAGYANAYGAYLDVVETLLESGLAARLDASH